MGVSKVNWAMIVDILWVNRVSIMDRSGVNWVLVMDLFSVDKVTIMGLSWSIASESVVFRESIGSWLWVFHNLSAFNPFEPLYPPTVFAPIDLHAQQGCMLILPNYFMDFDIYVRAIHDHNFKDKCRLENRLWPPHDVPFDDKRQLVVIRAFDFWS